MKKFSKDYYAILKISPSANSDEIRIAYRKLAKQNHPDLGGSAQAMADINEAYSVLQDNTIRQEYDVWYAKTYQQQSSKETAQNDSHFSEPPQPITIHILDPDTDYHSIETDISAIPQNVRNMVRNGELYTYIEYHNDKTTRVCISKDAFIKMQALYHTDSIKCTGVNFLGLVGEGSIPVDAIKNNYRRFLRVDSDKLYVKQENKEYYAITRSEFMQLRKQRESRFSKIAVLCVVLFVVAIPLVGHFLSLDSKDTYTPVVRVSPSHTPTSPPVPTAPIPKHESVSVSYQQEPNLEIHTSINDTAKYYYVKLADAATGETTQTVFIYAGQPTNIFVPYGTYVVKWCCGTEWYGYEKYFMNGSTTQAKDTFTFDAETSWELTLYPVSNGNLETEHISIDEF